MDYSYRFELQKYETAQSDCGDVSREWSTVYVGYGRLQGLGSTEFWQAAAVQQQDTFKLFARWHPAFSRLDPKDARILVLGMELSILAVENVGFRNEEAVFRVVRKQ